MFKFICKNKHISYSSSNSLDGGCPTCGEEIEIIDDTSLIRSLREFQKSAFQLMYVIDKYNAEELVSNGYPFNKSFDEILDDISSWVMIVEYNLKKN